MSQLTTNNKWFYVLCVYFVVSIKSETALTADASIPLCTVNATAVKQQQFDNRDGVKDDSPHEPKTNSIGCQTAYREQSAQTRPFSPMLKSKFDTELPEVALVADLIKGDGSSDVYETGIVIRARKRRSWEKLLQQIPASVIDQNEKRLILEAFEWENWLAREEEIENEQLERLNYVQQMLNKRSNINCSKSIGRLNDSIERVTSVYERNMKKIQ